MVWPRPFGGAILASEVSLNAFYFVTDEKFVDIASAQALHLRKIWPDCDVHIFLERRDSAFVPTQLDDTGILYHLDRLSGFLPAKLPDSKSWPNIVFLRLFAPRLLTQYDRLCYLDSDVLCMQSYPDLWTIPLPSGLGMVSDFATVYHAPFDLRGVSRDEWLASINVASGRYANSGMLLIDPKIFATYFFEHHLVKYFQDFPAADRFDQDFLNSFMDGKWTELGPRFNYQAAVLELGYTDIIDPVFIHFCRFEKPWWGQKENFVNPGHAKYTAIYDSILTAAGFDPAVFRSNRRLGAERRIKYALYRWLWAKGISSPRSKRMIGKWQKESSEFYRFLSESLSAGRFVDETRRSIPETAHRPWFDGRYARD